MSETYKKVFIKSEADLPKELNKQYWAKAKSDGLMIISLRWAESGNKRWWLTECDWYLQPIDNDVRDQIIKKQDELYEHYKIMPFMNSIKQYDWEKKRIELESELEELKKKMI